MSESNKKLMDKINERHFNGLGLSLLALGRDSSVEDWKQVIQSYPELNLFVRSTQEGRLGVYYSGHFHTRDLVDIDLNARQAHLLYHPHQEGKDEMALSLAYLQGVLNSQGIDIVYNEKHL